LDNFKFLKHLLCSDDSMRRLAWALIIAVLFLFAAVLFLNVCAESDFDGEIFSNDTSIDSTVTPPPTSSPSPTPIPTEKIMPGSPLSLGSATFEETIAQFDIINLAKLVIIALCIMWVIILLVSVDKKFCKTETEKQ
jgi:hypothetical protein